jgi:hypothetical protein
MNLSPPEPVTNLRSLTVYCPTRALVLFIYLFIMIINYSSPLSLLIFYAHNLQNDLLSGSATVISGTCLLQFLYIPPFYLSKILNF